MPIHWPNGKFFAAPSLTMSAPDCRYPTWERVRNRLSPLRLSGACFAEFGHRVTCVDKDAAKVARLRDGDIPIFEPDLDRLVAANMREGRLDFTTDLPQPDGEADRGC